MSNSKHVAYFGVADTYVAEGKTFTDKVAVEVTSDEAEKLVALDPGFKVVNKDGSVAKTQPTPVPAEEAKVSEDTASNAGSEAV